MKYLAPFLVTLVILSCSREIPNPTAFPQLPQMPPAPSGVAATIGDRMIRLSWQISDTTGIAQYRIYRSDSVGIAPVRFDSTQSTNYSDLNLVNGRQYFYQVTAVSGEGRESHRSQVVSAVPNIFSITIEGGAEEVNTRSVTLSLVAPSSTTLMRIANDISFASAYWEPFVATRQWVLTPGAGVKRVYAQFRNSDGVMMVEPVVDSITYVIRPYEFTVLVNGGDLQTFSRSVSLQLTAPPGTGFMKISTNQSFAGAFWEPFANNRDWLLTQSEAQNRDTVTFYVRFLDSAHDSIAVQATDAIIAAFADPVELFPTYLPDDHYQIIPLRWSISRSEDFRHYRIYRSRTVATVDTLVEEISDANIHTYFDTLYLGSLPTSTPVNINYMVRFFSDYGDSSDSDTMTVTVRNTQPTAVSCFVRSANFVRDTTSGRLNMNATIGWSRSQIVDFSHYALYENTAPNSSSSYPVSFVYDSENLSVDIVRNGVESTTVFYYWLKVFDIGGQSSAFSSPDSIRYR